MTAANVALKPTVAGISPTLVKPRFTAGMLLKHEDLEQMNAYTRELSRLLFRSFFGCGVVCGLSVDVVDNCGRVEVVVEAGVALACSGDPIHVAKNQRLVLDENCDPDLDGPLYVVLCATAKCCAPRTAACGCDEEDAHPECTRERSGFELRVESVKPTCHCGCGPDAATPAAPAQEEDTCPCAPANDPCYADHYAGKCGCECEDDCGGSCSCDCLLLARLDKPADVWKVEHGVRRFVRPVLMRDPKVRAEAEAQTATINTQQAQAQAHYIVLQDRIKAVGAQILDREREQAAVREKQRAEADLLVRQKLHDQIGKLTGEVEKLRQQKRDMEAESKGLKRALPKTVPTKPPKP